jgi:hypothetical protein
MKTKLLALALLAGGSLFAAPHVSVGIGIGVPGITLRPRWHMPRLRLS